MVALTELRFARSEQPEVRRLATESLAAHAKHPKASWLNQGVAGIAPFAAPWQ